MSCCWKIGMANRVGRVTGATGVPLSGRGRSGKTLLGKLRVFNIVDGRDNASKPVMLPGHDTSWRGPWIWQWQWESHCSACLPAARYYFSISSAADGNFCRSRQARHANGGLFAFWALTNCKRLCAAPQYPAKCLGAVIRARHNRGAFSRTRIASSAFLPA